MYGKKTPAVLSLIAARMGRNIGQFVLFVLLFNFLATAALSAGSLAQDDDLLSDDFSGGHTVIICTAQGLKRITLDEDGNPVDDDDSRLAHCIYCLPFHKVIANSASHEVAAPVITPLSGKRYFAGYIFLLTGAFLNAACPPRAPPLA